MHWLDELPRKLPESMREQLRGYPSLQDAWSACPHGPWLMRIAHASTYDRNAKSDYTDCAMELAVDVQAELDAHLAGGAESPNNAKALALDFLIIELRAAADGDGPELSDHRAKARPLADFDAVVKDWHKRIANKFRERFPHPA